MRLRGGEPIQIAAKRWSAPASDWRPSISLPAQLRCGRASGRSGHREPAGPVRRSPRVCSPGRVTRGDRRRGGSPESACCRQSVGTLEGLAAADPGQPLSNRGPNRRRPTSDWATRAHAATRRRHTRAWRADVRSRTLRDVKGRSSGRRPRCSADADEHRANQPARRVVNARRRSERARALATDMPRQVRDAVLALAPLISHSHASAPYESSSVRLPLSRVDHLRGQHWKTHARHRLQHSCLNSEEPSHRSGHSQIEPHRGRAAHVERSDHERQRA